MATMKSAGRSASANPAKYGNRSVLITVDILNAVATLNTSATLPAVARSLGMLESRAQRYLISLVATGLLEQDGTDRYTLGPALIDLGLTALGRLDSVRVASDTLFQLTQETGIVSLLSVWGSNGATVIKCEQDSPVASTHIREGRNLSLLQTATGRVFLAYLPEAETAPFLERELAAMRKAAPNGKLISANEIGKLKKSIRRQGIARSTGSMGNDAIAAPVFNHEGKLFMVIALFARMGMADFTHDHEPARKLRQAAAALSRRLGDGNPATVNETQGRGTSDDHRPKSARRRTARKRGPRDRAALVPSEPVAQR